MPKLRWDCNKRGCFNKKKRPNLEVFDNCFRGRISIGDVDGIVEINGNFLLMEWKDPSCPDVSGGQKYMYQNMTKDEKYTVVCVYGDCETMVVDSIQIYYKGSAGERHFCDLNELQGRVSKWAQRVQSF